MKESRLSHRDINDDQRTRTAHVMTYAKELERIINEKCKNNRERSLALTKLEECVMWCNKSISHENDGKGD